MKGSKITYIPAELASAAVGVPVTSTEQVKDYIKNKSQETINQDLESGLDRHENEMNGAGGLSSRISAVEELATISVAGGEIQIVNAASEVVDGSGKIPTANAVNAVTIFNTGESVRDTSVSQTEFLGDNTLVTQDELLLSNRNYHWVNEAQFVDGIVPYSLAETVASGTLAGTALGYKSLIIPLHDTGTIKIVASQAHFTYYTLLSDFSYPNFTVIDSWANKDTIRSRVYATRSSSFNSSGAKYILICTRRDIPIGSPDAPNPSYMFVDVTPQNVYINGVDYLSGIDKEISVAASKFADVSAIDTKSIISQQCSKVSIANKIQDVTVTIEGESITYPEYKSSCVYIPAGTTVSYHVYWFKYGYRPRPVIAVYNKAANYFWDIEEEKNLGVVMPYVTYWDFQLSQTVFNKGFSTQYRDIMNQVEITSTDPTQIVYDDGSSTTTLAEDFGIGDIVMSNNPYELVLYEGTLTVTENSYLIVRCFVASDINSYVNIYKNLKDELNSVSIPQNHAFTLPKTYTEEDDGIMTLFSSRSDNPEDAWNNGSFINWGCAVHIKDRLHYMYYEGQVKGVQNSGILFAYTTDGFTWHRSLPPGVNPIVRLYASEGYVDTNCVFPLTNNAQKPIAGISVVKVDDAEYPFRMLGQLGADKSNAPVYWWKSKNGIHWEQEKLILNELCDNQYTMIPHGNLIHVYIRMWQRNNLYNNQRVVSVMVLDLEGNVVVSPHMPMIQGAYQASAFKLDAERDLLLPTFYLETSDTVAYRSYTVKDNKTLSLGTISASLLKEDEDSRYWGTINPGFVYIGNRRFITYCQRNTSHGGRRNILQDVDKNTCYVLRKTTNLYYNLNDGKVFVPENSYTNYQLLLAEQELYSYRVNYGDYDDYLNVIKSWWEDLNTEPGSIEGYVANSESPGCIYEAWDREIRNDGTGIQYGSIIRQTHYWYSLYGISCYPRRNNVQEMRMIELRWDTVGETTEVPAVVTIDGEEYDLNTCSPAILQQALGEGPIPTWDVEGNIIPRKTRGTTAERPVGLTDSDEGYEYFDTSLTHIFISGDTQTPVNGVSIYWAWNTDTASGRWVRGDGYCADFPRECYTSDLSHTSILTDDDIGMRVYNLDNSALEDPKVYKYQGSEMGFVALVTE